MNPLRHILFSQMRLPTSFQKILTLVFFCRENERLQQELDAEVKTLRADVKKTKKARDAAEST